MHVEKRRQGTAIKYYLAHSVRMAGKVRKVRVYLGANLSPVELKDRRRGAEVKLKGRSEALAAIGDPYQAVLSPRELDELRTLEARGEPKIRHLSEEDWQSFVEAFTYDTNAIEGSTITRGEVEGILERDRWPDKPKGDISETYGVAKALKFMRETKEEISLQLVLESHRMVFANSKPFAGRLRGRGVEVAVMDSFGGIIHRGAPSTQVRRLLEELVRWYLKNRGKYPPLVLAAVVHNQFESIHPFQDGNGRVGRLLLNNILIKQGLPPVNIELRNRGEYYAALQAYEQHHNLRPTIELLLKEYRALKRSLKKR